MAFRCQMVPSADRFASDIIAFLDCQAQTVGAQGYQALAAAGSSASLVLTAMLTLFVALIGYRMLLGEVVTLREGVLSAVRIGIVLAFATSWPAYQTVVYDVVLRTPGNLAAAIGTPAGLPGASGGLPSRLDGIDQGFKNLAIYGMGSVSADPFGRVPPPQIAPPLFAGFDTFALGGSRVVFLATAIGSFALVRLTAGLLLALGPLFIGFLLFDATRGLFEGWLRALIGLALAALATALILGVELALLEPWISELLRVRSIGGSIEGVPAPLLASTTVFALVLTALLAIMGRIGFSMRLPSRERLRDLNSAHQHEQVRTSEVGLARSRLAQSEARSRAMAVADSIAATQRREERTIGHELRGPVSSSGTAQGRIPPSAAMPYPGLGQSGRRRTASRISQSVGVRDRRR